MEENRTIDNQKIKKWLQIVMYTAMVGFVNTLAGMLPFIPGAVTAWISRAIMAVLICAMFQLSSTNDRYKKAGIFRAVVLITAVAAELLSFGATLTLAVSVFSIAAEYQEYHAHSELIDQKDPKLSGKWTSLFVWSILSGVVIGFASTAAVFLVALAGMDTAKATAIIVAVLGIPQYVIDILYILYLKKMSAYFSGEAA